MLSTFRVQGFKSLSDTSVDLGLVNVFIGANGSGKSNLLEAVGVIGAAAFGSVEPETLRYRGVRPGLPSLYKTSLKKQSFRRFITLEAKSLHALYRVGLDNPINSPQVKWSIRTESLEQDPGKNIVSRSPRACNLYNSKGAKKRFDLPDVQSAAKAGITIYGEKEGHALNLISALENYAIFAPTTPVLRGIAPDLAREPLGLGGSGLPKAIRELTDKANSSFGPFELDDVWEMIEWAVDMSAVPVSQAPVSPSVSTTPIVLRFVDKYMRKERNTLSAYDASEGALYILFMLALTSHPKAPSVFAVDNFDQALHPKMACALTRMVADQLVADGRRQMLATTHNPLVLDGLNLLDDNIRLFAVDRDREGVTRIRRVTVTPEIMDSAKKGLGLSRLWVMGRLGGMPKSL
jgi:predicted ATPase